MLAQASTTRFNRCSGVACRPASFSAVAACAKRAQRRSTVVVAAVAGRGADEPHIQLATAKLPAKVAVDAFNANMYNWATTLTQTGANYPFVLPLKTDRLDSGFKISFLRKSPSGGFDSAGDIQATVELVPGTGNVLFVRFYEGPAGMADRRTAAPTDSKQRLEVVIQSLVDVDTIMNTMPMAIRNAVVNASA